MKIKVGETYTNRTNGRTVIVRGVTGHDVTFAIDGQRNVLRIRDFRNYYTDKTYKEMRMERLNQLLNDYQDYVTDYNNRIAEVKVELDEWERGLRDNQTWNDNRLED